MAGGEGDEIRQAFTEAAEQVGSGLGQDAAKAFKDLYKDSRTKLRAILRSSEEADGKAADDLKKVMQDMKANAAGEGSAAEKAAAQTKLYQKFKGILGGEDEAAGKSLASALLKGSGPEGKVPWIGGKADEGNLLGHLDNVVKDDNGLITHVVKGDEKIPIDDYTKSLADERSKMYKDAKEAGTFTKAETGEAMAIGVDRRTGAVYEGFNGTPDQVVVNPHPTLQARADDLRSVPGDPSTQNYNRNGEPLEYPGTDKPFGHAEVKAADAMLKARNDAGLADGDSALGEMSFAPQFPYKPRPPGSCCPNCNGILNGADLMYGGRENYGIARGSI